jgi:hypothetical protein
MVNSVIQGSLSEQLPLVDIPFKRVGVNISELILNIFTDSLMDRDYVCLLEGYGQLVGHSSENSVARVCFRR